MVAIANAGDGSPDWLAQPGDGSSDQKRRDAKDDLGEEGE
jgi:hypothetical protein